MAPVWPLLEINTNIKGFGYWDVAYKKKKWIISVSAEAIESKEEFDLVYPGGESDIGIRNIGRIRYSGQTLGACN